MIRKENNTLGQIKIEKVQSFNNLNIFPLIGKKIDQNIKLFENSLNDESLGISEIDSDGAVPYLAVENFNPIPVLIIDGQTITGHNLKQNRIVTVSVLIPILSKIKLSVLCSERGRWSRTDRRFASRDSAMFAKGRFAKMERMQQNMRENISENYHEAADQEQAWEQINNKFQSFDTYSSSESMQDIYENKEKKMKEYLDNLKMPENTLGAVFAIGASVMGFELFSNTNTFHSLYPKLLKSYALDAIENKVRDNSEPLITDAKKMIEMADSSVAKQCKNQGLGQLFTINNDDLCATVLMLDGVIVHFTCFSKNMQEEL